MVFIHGPAASGKHRIGSLLSARTGLPLFHNHLAVDLAKTLLEFGSESFIRLRAHLRLAAFAEAASAGRSFIFTFHPAATVARSLVDELVAIVESAGGDVCFVELRADRDTALQRLGNESRTNFGKLMDPGLYAEIESAGGFAFPAMPKPLLVIDTGPVQAEEAAAAIAHALRQSTLDIDA